MPFYQHLDPSEDKYYLTDWRIHQMSDHPPMWVELTIDYTDAFLQHRLRSADA